MNPDPFASSNPPENPQKKKHAVRKRVLIIVAVLVAVALSAAGYFVWNNYSGTAQTTEDESTLTPEEQAAKEKFAEINAKKQADAKEQLDGAVNAAERADAYIAMANAATDPDEKLSYALKAVDEDKNADTLMAAINFADIAGDTETLDKMSSEYVALGVESDRVE